MDKRYQEAKTAAEILELLLQDIKYHNDGDTTLEEFAVNVCVEAEMASIRLDQIRSLQN